ncbi:MAG: patatin-like phospholipase family protein [Flavobacteriales bacterium]|nr:patatin-like phospholipase family protein [Flavobacteriales bacterium]
MTQKKFTVLAIDGGGIRGILAAKFLASMEAELQRQGKEPRLRHHFDLICGTSTGSIIALALALDIPAQDIVELYRNNARRIFCKRSFGWVWSKYSRKPLERLVREVYRRKGTVDPCIIDLETRVCIPAYDLLTAAPRVFKTPHAPQLFRDQHIPAYMAALASAAAPTYFNPYTSSYPDILTGAEEQFQLKVDGGVFANNPALTGLIEAHRGLGVDLKNIRLLSIGTGRSTYSESRQRSFWGIFPKPWGRLYWLRKTRLLDMFMQAQSQATDFMVQILSGGVGAVKTSLFLYERVSVELGAQVKLPLDTKRKRNIKVLEEYGSREFQKQGTRIIQAFIDGNSYRNYTPPTYTRHQPNPSANG